MFLSVQPGEEKKLLPFLTTVMKTAESFQGTYVATSVPKTVSLLKEIKMIRDRNFKNQIFTACILESAFSDCLLQETIIDNCNK